MTRQLAGLLLGEGTCKLEYDGYTSALPPIITFDMGDYVFPNGQANVSDPINHAQIISHELTGHLSAEVLYIVKYGLGKYLYEINKLRYIKRGDKEINLLKEGYAWGINVATYAAIKDAYRGKPRFIPERFPTHEELLPVFTRHPYPSDQWLEAVGNKVPG